MQSFIKPILILACILGKSAVFLWIIWTGAFGSLQTADFINDFKMPSLPTFEEMKAGKKFTPVEIEPVSKQGIVNSAMITSFLVVLFFVSDFALRQVRLNPDA